MKIIASIWRALTCQTTPLKRNGKSYFEIGKTSKGWMYEELEMGFLFTWNRTGRYIICDYIEEE